MKILKTTEDINIIFNPTQDTNIDLGWEENFKDYEDDVLKKIINPIENYETVRFVHKEYSMPLYPSEKQNDIWFYFNFLNGTTYVQDYRPVGISLNENAKMLKQSTKSFFSLEFYKTPNDVLPDRINRRMVMTKNITLPLGEKYFSTTINDSVFMPIFTGSNFRNKENMNLYWFKDDTAFNETELTGLTFWMTAKFYNANDGTILDFVKSDISTTINETNDMYYKVVLNRTDYTYQVFNFYGERFGQSGPKPITFYQKRQ